MSLDVYLTMKGVQNLPTEPMIFVREDSGVKSITRKEWDERYPNRDPVYVELDSDDREVYWANITHNLGKMAGKAGKLYEALWRPDELGIKYAEELIVLLEEGLRLLKADPEKYKRYNPENGWGTYEGLVNFTEEYLVACRRYPKAEVGVWR